MKLNLPLNPILAAILCFTFLTLAPKANAEADGIDGINAIDGIVAEYTGEFPESAYKIKSYDQLMALSEEKRIEYLDELRQLVVELERMNESTAKGSQRSKDLNAFLLFVDSIIEKAEALTNVANVLPQKRTTASFWFFNKKTEVTCPKPLVLSTVNHRNYVCRKASYVNRNCGPGYVPIHQQKNGYFACVTQASYNALRAGDKVAMRKRNPEVRDTAATSAFLRGGPNYRVPTKPVVVAKPAVTPKRNAPGKTAGSTKLAADGKDRKPVKARTTPSKPSERSDGRTVAAADNGDDDQRPARRRRNRQRDEKTVGAVTPAPAAAENKDSDRIDEKSEVVKLEPPPEGFDEDAPVTEADLQTTDKKENAIIKCLGNRGEQQCSQAASDKARAELGQTDNNLCLYAGNFSFWEKVPRDTKRCRPPFEFCYGFASCRDKDDNRLPAATVNLKCEPDQVICNPYIFSIKKNGDPFCVARTADATNACNALTQSPARTSSGEIIPLVARESNHYLFKIANQTTDQKRLLIAGYNAFVEKMNEMCFSNEKLKTLFCTECNVIKRRVLWMNANALTPRDGKACEGFRTLGTEKLKTRETTPSVQPASTQRQDGVN